LEPEAAMAWCRGRAYSQDLRDRVLAAVEHGFSAREVGEQFQVSPSYVIKARQRLERTGERSARPQCSHTPCKLSEHQHEAIRAQVAAKPDATMAELRAWVLREQGVSISLASMWTTLSRLGLTLKKSPARRRTGPPRCGRGARRVGQTTASA
jgi:transposase